MSSIFKKTFYSLLFISFFVGLIISTFVSLRTINYFKDFAHKYSIHRYEYYSEVDIDDPIPTDIRRQIIKNHMTHEFTVFLLQTFLIVFIIASIISYFLAYTLSKNITTPLNKLALRLEENTNKDRLFYKTLKPSGPNEIKSLIISYNKLVSKLNSIEKTRQQLISDISHELKTPLTKLSLTLQGIKDGILKPNKQTLEVLNIEVKHLSNLIHRIQEIAEITNKPVKKQKINLLRFVQKIVDTYASYTKNKYEFKINIPRNFTIIANKNRLKELFDNLISNAIKFSPRGGIIEIGAKSNYFYIKDTGIGIPKKDLNKVFNRFYRASNSSSVKGSGLGLAIVNEIVKLHGWRIKVKSKQGKGTTFIIYV